jgi:hypothetical protein
MENKMLVSVLENSIETIKEVREYWSDLAVRSDVPLEVNKKALRTNARLNQVENILLLLIECTPINYVSEE